MNDREKVMLAKHLVFMFAKILLFLQNKKT